MKNIFFFSNGLINLFRYDTHIIMTSNTTYFLFRSNTDYLSKKVCILLQHVQSRVALLKDNLFYFFLFFWKLGAHAFLHTNWPQFRDFWDSKVWIEGNSKSWHRQKKHPVLTPLNRQSAVVKQKKLNYVTVTYNYRNLNQQRLVRGV